MVMKIDELVEGLKVGYEEVGYVVDIVFGTNGPISAMVITEDRIVKNVRMHPLILCELANRMRNFKVLKVKLKYPVKDSPMATNVEILEEVDPEKCEYFKGITFEAMKSRESVMRITLEINGQEIICNTNTLFASIIAKSKVGTKFLVIPILGKSFTGRTIIEALFAKPLGMAETSIERLEVMKKELDLETLHKEESEETEEDLKIEEVKPEEVMDEIEERWSS